MVTSKPAHLAWSVVTVVVVETVLSAMIGSG